MKKNFITLVFVLIPILGSAITLKNGALLKYTISDSGDTIFSAQLPTCYIYPKMVFKNKRQERFYWRTVRDVKKTLPYAKIAAKSLAELEDELTNYSSDVSRSKFMKEYQKKLFENYEADLRKMTVSQGIMLVKLIDRECEKSSYEIIKLYRGGISATFWQGIAKMFGNDLKMEFDVTRENDAIIERVINLVEAGQL
jgi:hypothetical protein